MHHPSGFSRQGDSGAVWDAERLTQRQFPRARFRQARQAAARLWGRLIAVRELAHDGSDVEGQFLALEMGDVLLTTLDLGHGSIGWQLGPPDEGTAPLLLLRIIRGGQLDAGSGGMHDLPAGQIALMPLVQGVELHLPQGGRCDLALIHNPPVQFDGFHLLAADVPSGHHLAFVAGYLLRCAPHPPGRTAELRQNLLQTLRHVAIDLQAGTRAPSQTAFERFKFLISASLGRGDLALEEIAAAMELHPRRLQRLLKDQGTSFRAHLLGRRLEMAHELLMNSAAPLRIADVAWRCGFRDPNYFSRAYTRHWKIPPRQTPQAAPLSGARKEADLP